MLTLVEKVAFGIAVLTSLSISYLTFRQMVKIVLRGTGALSFDHLPQRLLTGIVVLVNQAHMIRHRPTIAVLHGFIAWGFIYYLLVNVGDLLEGYIPDFRFLGDAALGNWYRLLADLLSIVTLAGMIFFLPRRFVSGTSTLTYHDKVKLHPCTLPARSHVVDAIPKSDSVFLPQSCII